MNYILKDDNKFPLFKELYFPDSHGLITLNDSNVYSLYTRPYDYEDQITLCHVFQHHANTDDRMIITFSYIGFMNQLHIIVTKNQYEISQSGGELNPNHIDATYNIPNNCLGKQLWIWMWINNNYLNIIFSGLSPKKFNYTTGLKNLRTTHVYKVNVFTRVRSLITKNIYDNKSEAYLLINKFEEDEGTIT